MKNGIFTIVICLPFLALGQSKTLVNTLSNSRDVVEISAEKQLVSISPDDKQLETTLIDDRRYYKSFLNSDLKKSYDSSFTLHNPKSYSFSEGQNLEALKLKFNPTKTLDLQFSNPINTKRLF